MKIMISLSAAEVKLTAKDIRDLEKDPSGMAKVLYLSDLVSILKQSNERYHSDGTSLISDRVFDVLKDELALRSPGHKFLQQVGAPVKTVGSRKVKLPFPLFSLDKLKPDDGSFDKWIASHPGPYSVSDKEDGSSLEIVYDRPGIKIYTRGDGVMGQDITFLAPHLDIPSSVPTSKRFVVRAEAIMTQAAFEAYFKGTYRNARNLVAGAMNKRTLHESVPHIHVMAYEVIEPRMKPSTALAKLKQYGFRVVPFKVYGNISVDMLQRMLKTRKSKSVYDIDGLVIEQDKVTTRPKPGNNPGYAVAFKVAEEDQMHKTKVIRVEWNDSKHGAVKPTIHIEPVELPGNTIKKVTGHNAFFIEHGYRQKDVGSGKGLPIRPIGPGAIVKIIRSGDVIPHIVEVIKGASRPQMPKVPYRYGKSAVDIYTMGAASDLTKEKRITSFFVTVGVDYMKLATVQKMVQIGLNTIPKILDATADDFLRIPGFKETMADKLYEAIQSKTQRVELHTLMDASGVFGAGLGERRMKPLVEKYPSLLNWGDLTTGQIEQRVLNVPGFNALAKQFAIGLPKFIKWLASTRIKPILPAKVRKLSSKLSGQIVVMTGFRDEALSSMIISNGGQVGTGVSSKTTILLAKDPHSGSSKLLKAQQMGIKVMSADDFVRRFKLN